MEIFNCTKKKIENGKPVNLSNEEEKIFDRFIDYFFEMKSNDTCEILFRGVNSYDFWNKLENHYGETSGLNKFDKLFITGGEKPKSYLIDNYKKVKKSKYLKNINDISDRTCSYIFKELHKLLKNESRNKRVKEFIKKNTAFTSFFLDYSNLNVIAMKMKERTSEEEMLQIRDYYFFLLHTTSSLRKCNYTYFISSSSNINEAKYFYSNSPSGIINYIWYPKKRLETFGVNRTILSQREALLSRHNLPTYSLEIFPRQKEFMIKGAIFPHYLLGIYDSETNSFIINNNFPFNALRNSDNFGYAVTRIILFGFAINQTRFDEFLNDTKFYKGVQRCFNGIYSERKVN